MSAVASSPLPSRSLLAGGAGDGTEVVFPSGLPLAVARERLRRGLGEDIPYVVGGARSSFRLAEGDDGHFDLEKAGPLARTFATVEIRPHGAETEVKLRLRPRAVLLESGLVVFVPLTLLFAGLAMWQLAVQAFAAAAILAIFTLTIFVLMGRVLNARLDREIAALRSGFESMLATQPEPTMESARWAEPARGPIPALDVSKAEDANQASMRRRGAALLVDIGTIGVGVLLLTAVAGRLALFGGATSTRETVGMLGATLGSAAYFLGSWILGATPGMRLVGIGIVGKNGERAGVVSCLVRLVVFAIELILIALATLIYIGLGGSEVEEGLISWATFITWPALALVGLLAIPAALIPHDRVAGTRVIRL